MEQYKKDQKELGIDVGDDDEEEEEDGGNKKNKADKKADAKKQAAEAAAGHGAAASCRCSGVHDPGACREITINAAGERNPFVGSEDTDCRQVRSC